MLLLSGTAVATEPPMTPSRGNGPESKMDRAEGMDDVHRAIEAGNHERAIALLKQLGLEESSPRVLDEISRTFERLGWLRDARIVADRIANHKEAEPTLRVLHVQRSQALEAKASKAWLSLPQDPNCALRFVNEAAVKAKDNETEVEPGQSLLECRSANGKQLSLFHVNTMLGRRVARDTRVPMTELVVGSRSWNGLNLNGRRIQSDLRTISGLKVSAGKLVLLIEVDDGAPLRLELDGKPGQRFELQADVEAALRLRDLRRSKELAVRNQAGPYITTAVGALIAGAGWALLAVGESDRLKSQSKMLAQEAATKLAQSATEKETSGGLLLGVGITAGVTGLVWYLVNMARGRKAARQIEESVLGRDSSDTSNIKF